MGCCTSKKSIKVSSSPNILHFSSKNLEKVVFTAKTPHTRSVTIHEVSKIRRSSHVTHRVGPIEDHYTILEKIGSGGYGNVFQGIDKHTGFHRALKCIKKNKLKTKNLMREVENLQELDHPNILRVMEVLEDSENFWIITELCKGPNLFEKISKFEVFSENQAAKYMHDILSALSHCHKAGIIHRDIKPENLLFETSDENSVLKIIDFGTSRKITEDIKCSELIGTPYYVAPEVLEGAYDEKCDIWSCGVILYIMLSGSPPFNGLNTGKIFKKVKQASYSFSGAEWAGISEDAKDLISKLLEKDPNLRYTAEEALMHIWIKSRTSNSNKGYSVSSSVINHLRHFNSSCKLKISALRYIANNLSNAEEIKEIRELFLRLDLNGDGKLSRDELRSGCKMLGINKSADIEDLMERCDADGNGYIDYTEFIIATMDWENKLSMDKLKEAFEAYDIDGTGGISIENLKKFFSDDLSLNPSDFEDMLKEGDVNGDGIIDINDFIALMNFRT